jgi:hypothetical protein
MSQDELLRVVQLSEDGFGGGRGCVVSRAVRAGDVLLRHSNQTVLFRHSPHLCPAAARLVRESDDDAPVVDQVHELAVILMLECAAQSASHFAGFIAQLPASFDCLPEEWTDAQLEKSMHSVARALLAQRRRTIRAVFEGTVRPWCDANAPQCADLQLFRRCYLAVSSRAQWFNACAFPALVPVGDMINHSSQPNAAFGSRFEVLTRIKGAGAVPSDELLAAADVDEWFVASLRTIAAGEQVFIQYCDEVDEVDLFLNHGIPTTRGAAIVPLPSHAFCASVLGSAVFNADALLPALIDEEREHRVVFTCNNAEGFGRAFDAFRLMLASAAAADSDANLAVFAAVRAQSATSSDAAAAILLKAVCEKILSEPELPSDAMQHRTTVESLQEFCSIKTNINVNVACGAI